jgi:hypothetical protein
VLDNLHSHDDMSCGADGPLQFIGGYLSTVAVDGNSGGNNVVQLCPHGDTVANRNNFEEDMSGDNGSISPVQQQQQPLRQ